MKYRFIPTDEVSEMSDAYRDLAAIHKDDHDPDDHTCAGCLHPEKEECWARRHGEEMPESREARPMNEYDARDCRCGCHYLVDQCRFTQDAVKNDGRPFYKLETEHDGWSMILPAAVYDTFMALDDESRDRVVVEVIEHAKVVQEMSAERNREGEDE